MKLNVKAFTITCALLWGCGVLCLIWWIMMSPPMDNLLHGLIAAARDLTDTFQ
jgi:hypothetical protein